MDDTTKILLAINLGTLIAVIYGIRIIVLLERKLAKLMEQKGL